MGTPVWCRVGLVAALLVVGIVVLRGLDVVALWKWYTKRFVRYYSPKAALVQKLLRRLPDLPDDVYNAWDVAVAVIAIASVFHLIERVRVAMLTKLRDCK